MRRRDFLGAVSLAALALSSAALAVELALDENDRDGKRSVGSFQQELQELGWTSENLLIEYRWGDHRDTRSI